MHITDNTLILATQVDHDYGTLEVVVEEITTRFKKLLEIVDNKITEVYKLDKESWGKLDDVEKRCKEWIKEVERVCEEQVSIKMYLECIFFSSYLHKLNLEMVGIATGGFLLKLNLIYIT